MGTQGRWALALAPTADAPWEVAARLEHLEGDRFVHEFGAFAQMLGSEVERGMPDDIARADLFVVLRPWLRRRAATCRRDDQQTGATAEAGDVEAAFFAAAQSACRQMAWDRATDFLPLLANELAIRRQTAAPVAGLIPGVVTGNQTSSPEQVRGGKYQLTHAIAALAEAGRALEAVAGELARAGADGRPDRVNTDRSTAPAGVVRPLRRRVQRRHGTKRFE